MEASQQAAAAAAAAATGSSFKQTWPMEEAEFSARMSKLERQLAELASRFRYFMNLYGLCEDITLLLVPLLSQKGQGGREQVRWSRSLRGGRQGQGSGGGLGWLKKLFSLALVLTANCLAIYVLVAHLIWEFRLLDGKSGARGTGSETGGGAGQQAKGGSVLKEFLENLRRHLARIFSLGLTLIWHFSCHRIELLFSDCCRYYFMFYKSFAGLSGPELGERRAQLLESGVKFYKLARARIGLAIWMPILHYFFNISSLTMFPSSSNRATTKNRLTALYYGHKDCNQTTGGARLLCQALDNFDSFHRAIHTGFHPYEHRIPQSNPVTTQSEPLGGSELALEPPGQVSALRSASYALLELFVYSIYIHGPRIICATCLSLVLNIHYQCIKSFNRQLVERVRRGRGRPLTNGDIVSLVKQYDLIGMMHERIEATFKWSMLQSYTLMFVSCLIHIFSFTESTSAYVVSSGIADPGGANLSAGAQLQARQQQPEPAAPTSIAAMFIRLASVVFVCYSPYLIYCEAFKIESASNGTERSVMLLARRHDDPLAQSIEPSLFEPICLSVGGYFSLSKRSLFSFLGAIVTFSVMFIGEQASPSNTTSSRPN